MGIQGLLPLLKPIHKEVNLSQFSGQTIGVDTYCWLHKGAYGCAMDIVEGKKTKVYLNYVIKRLDMMLYHNVKPYLVLDGGHLPSKANKEAERRKSRQDNKAKGLAFLRAGNRSQALDCFQKCVDITPEMALEVIKVCRERGIDYVVAPYEADSQLAYLMKTGKTQATISEDSDLLVYGCNKVVFKMDEYGAGTLVDLADLPKLKDLKMHEFTMEKFRHMCILSGCDYLPSIKGVGLKTANKLIRKHATIEKLVRSVRLENKLKVPVDYEKNFKQADETFLYQMVFDPNTYSLVPLTPLPDGILPGQLQFAGPLLPKEKGLAIALGNINPITHETMDNYDPEANMFDSPVETKIEKSCAFSFSNTSTVRQSLTPTCSSLLNNTQNHDNEHQDARVTSVDKCRRFLLPPLKQTSKEHTPGDKDLVKIYTFLKQKNSTTHTTLNRLPSRGCGISRRTRRKNPFRATNDLPITKTNGQTSCYFKTSNPVRAEDDKDDDDDVIEIAMDINGHKDMPALPVWDNIEKDTSDEEEQKENSPIDSSTFSKLSPRRDRSPGKVLSEALQAVDRTSGLVIEQQSQEQSQKNNVNNSSTDSSYIPVISKPLKGLSLRTQDDAKTPPLPLQTTPMGPLHKFVYKPTLRDSVDRKDTNDKEITSMDLTHDNDVTDSGYLSDGEDGTNADTPSYKRCLVDRVQNPSETPRGRGEFGDDRNYKRPIQLNSAPTKRRTNGLGRCKSLGISKRKYNTKNPIATGHSSLLKYFEFNKSKRARLESS